MDFSGFVPDPFSTRSCSGSLGLTRQSDDLSSAGHVSAKWHVDRVARLGLSSTTSVLQTYIEHDPLKWIICGLEKQ
jgi:hypothetical protein